MNSFAKPLVAALLAASALSIPLVADARSGAMAGGFHGSSPASAHGGWHGGGHRGGFPGRGWSRGYWGPGPFWGGLGLGLSIGAIGYYGAYGAYGAYDEYYPYPGVVVAPATPGYVVVDPAAGDRVVRSVPQPVPLVSRAPDPIFYPKSGQSAAKTESDRQDCNRWATTQTGAMSDASIFQRATFACMEGRGYSVR